MLCPPSPRNGWVPAILLLRTGSKICVKFIVKEAHDYVMHLAH